MEASMWQYLYMGWRILVFHPEPEASTIYFDSDMSEYKYGSILWLEDGNLYKRLRKKMEKFMTPMD